MHTHYFCGNPRRREEKCTQSFTAIFQIRATTPDGEKNSTTIPWFDGKSQENQRGCWGLRLMSLSALGDSGQRLWEGPKVSEGATEGQGRGGALMREACCAAAPASVFQSLLSASPLPSWSTLASHLLHQLLLSVFALCLPLAGMNNNEHELFHWTGKQSFSLGNACLLTGPRLVWAGLARKKVHYKSCFSKEEVLIWIILMLTTICYKFVTN